MLERLIFVVTSSFMPIMLAICFVHYEDLIVEISKMLFYVRLAILAILGVIIAISFFYVYLYDIKR